MLEKQNVWLREIPIASGSSDRLAVRAHIVHGEDIEKELGKDFFLRELVVEVEEILRKSLKKFI
jgi:hypothetical protein